MKRFTRTHASHLYVAQESRRDARAGNFQFATAEGNAAAVVDSSMPDAAGPDTLRRDADSPSVLAPASGTLPQQGAIFGLRRLQFILPMPPSVNALYGVAKTGQKYLLPEQRQFRSRVIGIVKGQMVRAEQRAQPLTGRLFMGVTWYFADRRRTDISNRWKALEDALTHAGAYVDDSQIDSQHGDRAIVPGRAEQCVVMLQEIGA